MKLKEILNRLETIVGDGVETYSILTRQEVIALRIAFAKAKADNRAEKKMLARKLKKYHADKLAELRNQKDEKGKNIYSLEDAKGVIQLDVWYMALEVENDAYEYLDDICEVIKDTFGELITLIRDAERGVDKPQQE